jgi:hypothetical protein
MPLYINGISINGRGHTQVRDTRRVDPGQQTVEIMTVQAAAGVGANDQFRQLQENGLLPGEEGALAFLEAQRRVSSAKCQVPSFPGAKGKAFAARRRELAAACPQVA